MPQKQPITLNQIYDSLYAAFGPQYWWPGNTRLEIIVGAILTQNTNWQNVEKAIKNCKDKKILSVKALLKIPVQKLAVIIKPAGFFNVKAKRLKNFILFLEEEYEGSIKKMMQESLGVLRKKLLNVNGVGPETADSILLYACDRPIFVVDAYTKRILLRHKLVLADAEYHQMQRYFMKSLKSDLKVFNEFHALFVRLGKEFCKIKALCDNCPLKKYL